jgi:hypothetical protein
MTIRELIQRNLLPYNTSVQIYTGSKQVVIAPYLNGITVKNEGNTNVIFQGDTLLPGDSKSQGGNTGEVYWARIDITFQVPVPAPAVINNSAVVSQKYYIFDNE